MGVAAIAETYCCCRARGHGTGHDHALARIEQGNDIYETAGLRTFETAVCKEVDCLKYCPADGCRASPRDRHRYPVLH